MLSPSMRNHVLPCTSGILQKSYQPRQIREDLMAAFAPNEANGDQELFNFSRQSSLYCNNKAPIYVERSDIEHWDDTREEIRLPVHYPCTGSIKHLSRSVYRSSCLISVYIGT